MIKYKRKGMSSANFTDVQSFSVEVTRYIFMFSILINMIFKYDTEMNVYRTIHSPSWALNTKTYTYTQ